MLRRLGIFSVLLAGLLFAGGSAQAQTKVDGLCERQLTANAPGPLQLSVSCTVTVYLTGTTTLATIYSDASSTVKANPFTADNQAYWFFFASAGTYDIRFSGGNPTITPPYTRSAISTGSGGGGGSGTVTSVTVGSLSPLFTTAVTNPTGAADAEFTLIPQSAHAVLIGPLTGVPTAPTFRVLDGSDLPLPTASTLGGINSKACGAGNAVTTIGTDGSVTCTPVSGTPGGVSGDVQTNDGAGGFAGGTQLSVLSQKPVASNGIQYWSPSGNDANDGLSWGTAKKTFYAACEALRGGSASPPTCGAGVIYMTENGSGADAYTDTSYGIQLVGSSSDSIWAAPTNSWLRLNGGLRVVGVGCQNSSTPKGPTCYVNGGSPTDSTKPGVWITASSTAIEFENLTFRYPAVGMKLGITSAGARTGAGSGVQNFRCTNCSVQVNQSLANGPGVDMADNTFWIYLIDGYYANNYAAQSIIGATGGDLTRSSNVVTVHTTGAHGLTTGEKFGIKSADDSTFDGSFVVTGSADSTHFTYAQTGPDTTSANGYVIPDRALPVVIDPGSGTGSGLIFLERGVYGGGLARLWTGVNNGGVDAKDITIEGDGSHPVAPAVWISSVNSGLPTVDVNHIEVADALDPTYAVRNDFPTTLSNWVLSNRVTVCNVFGDHGIDIYGPMTSCGGAGTKDENLSPLRKGQLGVFGGHLIGQTDNNYGSAQLVRFASVANSFPGAGAGPTWSATTFCGVTTYTTTGITDPDGGTAAVQTTNTSDACTNYLNFYNNNRTVTAGDIFISFVRVRSLATGGGYKGSQITPLLLGFSGATVKTSFGYAYAAPNAGDGEWEWVGQITKIASTSAATVQVQMAVQFALSYGLQAYSPILLHIPAGTISDNDALLLANNIRSYHSACTAGYLCDPTGPVPDAVTPLVIKVANTSPTGTTVNKLAKLTGAPSTALIAATTDTAGVAGIVVLGAGTTGNAFIARSGIASCVFDGATTAGDYVQISSSTAGDCHDAGSSLPATGQLIGRVLSTNGGGGTYQVALSGADLQAGSAGGYYQTVDENGTAKTQRPAINFINGTNMTISCADNGGASRTDCTFTSSATGATAFSALTASTNSNAGTFAASGNTWNFSAASGYTLPTVGAVFPGSGSGSATVVAQATAGTPTLTLPNASGTFAVSATSPLSLSATTGALTCSTCTTNASALTANQLIIGGGSNAAAALGSLGTTSTLLHGNAGGAPSFGAVVSADLNITGTTCTNQFVSAISSAAAGTCTAFTLAGAQFANQGTTTTVLHGNAAGNPSWGAVTLTTDVTGTLPAGNGGTGNAFFAVAGPAASTKTFTFPNASSTVLTSNAAVTVAQGGTGVTTLTNHGVLLGQATSNIAATTAGTSGQCLLSNGASSDPSFQNCPTGSGTVNSGTANQITYYAATGTVVSGDSRFTDDGTTLTYTGSGGIVAGTSGAAAGTVTMPEGTAPTGVASKDILYADSTAHRVKMNNNNGTAATVAALEETAVVYNCGTTTTCANTAATSPHVVIGSVALASASPSTATITAISPAFTSTSTYSCTVTEVTDPTKNLLGVTYVSGSSFTITGPNTITDTVRYICVGY